ncbi:uncharacterized protein LOC126990431 isoform X3 [Eriocheir sinensis]|uniref:uncharacterized protein LOC126990431 isoform X3 n=1 Tax=Eriocheir sinensis TaxID=95602 RepID=UPI0021C8860B|nr:uncharacterized protein LOC126990431 isoform X3 [Eriocheir sinensis]
MAVRAPSPGSMCSLYQHQSLPSVGPPQGQLLRGPRRVVRLCVFALLLPATLITIPLYVRLVLYPPAHYPMMPTDQRLLARHASSFWCQAQSTHMNGSFTSYLTKGKPEVGPERRTYAMLNHLKAQDDVKEYWGFYFLRGSTVTISTCARWDGGQLMILRGVENLHRCAWIGEEDSSEDMAEDDDDISNERHRLEALGRAHEPSVFQAADNSPDPEESLGAEGATPSALPMHSEERRQGITKLLRKALKMSKSNKEILRILHSEGRKRNSFGEKLKVDSVLENSTESSENHMLDEMTKRDGNSGMATASAQETQGEQAVLTTTPGTPGRLRKASKKLKDDISRREWRRLNKGRKKKKGNNRDKNLTEEEPPARTRLRREAAVAAAEEDTNGAFEVLDTDGVLDMLRQDESKPSKPPAEEIAVGAQVFFPEGLKFERGKFNQTTANDHSREEHVSSYSSSEEALASCEGVILSLPLVPYRSCSYQSLGLNKISYDIPITGTYYFVFSSDNEIYVNDLYFNITMERVVYNVTKSEEMCHNTTDCIMPLSFWSNDQTVVEVPPEATWDHSYVMDIKCEPRVYVYLTLLLLVPLFILCCAFN